MTPTLTPPVSLEEANLLAQALDLLASGPCLTSAESPVDLIVNGRRMAEHRTELLVSLGILTRLTPLALASPLWEELDLLTDPVRITTY